MSDSAAPSSSAATAAPATPAGAAPAHFGENKGIKFHIKTGNTTWACTLQDRSIYERKRAARQDSLDSVSSTSTTSSI